MHFIPNRNLEYFGQKKKLESLVLIVLFNFENGLPEKSGN